MVYLGVVGLLDLILVHFNLQLMLVAHIRQCLGQFAFKLLLVAIIQFNHAGLMTPLYLPQLLLKIYQQ